MFHTVQSDLTKSATPALDADAHRRAVLTTVAIESGEIEAEQAADEPADTIESPPREGGAEE